MVPRPGCIGPSGCHFSPFALLALARSTRDGWSPSSVLDGRMVSGGRRQPDRRLGGAGSRHAGAVIVLYDAGIALGRRRRSRCRAKAIAFPMRRAAHFHSVLGHNRDVALRHDLWHLFVEPVSRLLSRARHRDERSHRGGGGGMLAGFGQARTDSPLATLLLIAIGLKFAYWCYYVPEWNYRYSQGPWKLAQSPSGFRANGRCTLSTVAGRSGILHEAFGAAVAGSEYLKYQGGDSCKFVLLLPAEFENWPASAPPVAQISGPISRRYPRPN